MHNAQVGGGNAHASLTGDAVQNFKEAREQRQYIINVVAQFLALWAASANATMHQAKSKIVSPISVFLKNVWRAVPPTFSFDG